MGELLGSEYCLFPCCARICSHALVELFRYHLFKVATAIASRVVMFLPRNSDLDQLADMCLSIDPPWAVEVCAFVVIFVMLA